MATIDVRATLLKRCLPIGAALLAGCVHAPTPVARNDGPCTQVLERLPERVRQRAASLPWGSADPAYPLLRGNRVLDAWPPGLATQGRRDWLSAALSQGLLVWRAALAGEPPALRASALAQLRRCGRTQVNALAASAGRTDAVRRALRAGDAYTSAARVLGAYPLAVPAMRLGIAAWKSDAQRAFAAGLPAALTQRYVPLRADTRTAQGVAATAQLLPGLDLPHVRKLRGLIDRHAPVLHVSTHTRDDRLGGLGFGADGQVAVDVRRPIVDVQLGSAWLLGKPRLQLTYTAWFPARTAAGPLDPYAGHIDGLMWRVTLDSDGRALVHDAIHPCGCFHMVFPVADLQAAALGFWQEAPLVPGAASPGRVRVDLRAGDHQVVGLDRADTESGGVAYALRPYTDLLAQPHPRGDVASVFASDGRIPGTARLERFYLWPSGVPSPGAMRVWGRHAIAFVGKAHFDDPHLLDTRLVRQRAAQMPRFP